MSGAQHVARGVREPVVAPLSLRATISRFAEATFRLGTWTVLERCTLEVRVLVPSSLRAQSVEKGVPHALRSPGVRDSGRTVHLEVAPLEDGPARLVGHLDAVGLLRTERGLGPAGAVFVELHHLFLNQESKKIIFVLGSEFS
jgi:hypothetical protein